METAQCGNCKFRAQSGYGYCEHPNQENEDLKKYVYWNFSCNLFKKGVSKSTAEYSIKVWKDEIKALEQMIKNYEIIISEYEQEKI